MKGKEAALIVMVVYLFHITRNITPLYFLLLGGAIVTYFYLSICNSVKAKVEPLIFVVLMVWLYASFISVAERELYGDPAVGLVRLWTSIPLVFVALTLSKGHGVVASKTIAIFFACAALSFVWQYSFGAIDWFAESSERAGGTRFASLAGSLTAYGTLVGFPVLVVLVYFPTAWKWSLFLLLTLGALMSLQKAAIVNVIIALLIACWLGAIRTRTVVLGTLVAMIGSLATLLLYAQPDGGVVARFIVGLLTSDSSISADVPLFESILDRVASLPAEALSFHGNEVTALGAGVFGGGGALGYPEIPMAHNGLVEIIAIFGYFVGGAMVVSLLALLGFSALRLMRRPSSSGTSMDTDFLCGAYVIWFVNYLFSGGGLFHPIGAAIFWLIVFGFIWEASKPHGHRIMTSAPCVERES